MTGGQQRRPSFDMTVDDTAYLFHELDTIDPAQQQKQKHQHTELELESEDKNDIDLDITHSRRTKTSNIDFLLECRLFFELAGVSTLLSLSFISSSILTASYIGRNFPIIYLSCFTLANLTSNLSTFAVMAGLMSASDTLSPQAYSKQNYQEVGRIAIRGFVVCCGVLIPINLILFFYLDFILIQFCDQDREASHYAKQWYRIFSVSLPFQIVYNCLWKFLTAQHIMKPLILVSLISTLFVLPIGLKILISVYGFLGSAYAYLLFQIIQTLLLVTYLWYQPPHHPQTWPITLHNFGTITSFIQSSLQWSSMKEFLYLGFGGVVAQCEWVFWEAVGLLVGSLGVVSLSVHTIPNQTIMTFCMIPFSFGIALAIRMGISLPISVTRTKILVIFVLFFSMVVFGLVSIGVYIYRRSIVALFTSNHEVQELAELIFVKVALFNFNIAIFAILAGIATGLGKQWLLGIINFIFLWIFGLPIIYYKAIVCDGGLNAVWYWMNIPYLGMNITLCILFSYLDWYKIQKQIINNNENSNNNEEEEEEVEEEVTVKDGDKKEVDEEDKRGMAPAADEKTTLLRTK